MNSDIQFNTFIDSIIATSEPIIEYDKSYIVRCDGRSFSKFTRGFKKPFDELFKKAMKHTLDDAFLYFHATTGYCHSDEISLFFKKKNLETSSHLFGGRRFKIITTIASYISVRFNYYIVHFINQKRSEYDDNLVEKVMNMSATFDGRIAVIFETDDNIYDYFKWRSNDCYRNCISGYALYYYSPKELHQKKIKDMIKMICEKNQDLRIPGEEKYGIYVKKEKYDSTMVDVKTNEIISCERHRIFTKIIDITKIDKMEFIEWIEIQVLDGCVKQPDVI